MRTDVRLYDAEGREGGVLGLSFAFGEVKDLNKRAYACSVRVIEQNGRQATSCTKTRGEVALTNKKPWRQKGTGRARAGSARSPLWRSGGVVFGPKPGARVLKSNKRTRQAVLASLVAQSVESGRILCLDAAFGPKARGLCADARQMLKKLNLFGVGVTLFLSRSDDVAYLAFRNMPKVKVVFYDQPDVVVLSGLSHWLFFKKDKERFESMVGK